MPSCYISPLKALPYKEEPKFIISEGMQGEENNCKKISPGNTLNMSKHKKTTQN
jgi:hypothetical protein